MRKRRVYNETGHPYTASWNPHSGYLIRTREAKSYRVAHGRGGELLGRLSGDGSLVGAEIGVNQADLSHYLLAERPGLTLWMVDIWALDKGSDYYDVAMERTEPFAERRVVKRMTSEEAALLAEDGVIDFVFLDADHSYKAVKADIEVWRPKLKPNGLLCGHDIHMRGVRRAVDELVPGWRPGNDSTWFAPIAKRWLAQ